MADVGEIINQSHGLESHFYADKNHIYSSWCWSTLEPHHILTCTPKSLDLGAQVKIFVYGYAAVYAPNS